MTLRVTLLVAFEFLSQNFGRVAGTYEEGWLVCSLHSWSRSRMLSRSNLHLLSILCSLTLFHLLMPLHTSACWWAFAAHALVPAYALTPTRTLVPAHAFVLPCTHLYPIMPLHPPCSCSHTWTHTHSCTHLHPYARSQLRHLVKLSLLNYFVFWILVRLPVVWS